jgi:hypothetical protein
MMSYPPRRLFDVWHDADYSQCRSKADLLLIGVARLDFALTAAQAGKPNGFALYDLGQAMTQIGLQAVALGLAAHVPFSDGHGLLGVQGRALEGLAVRDDVDAEGLPRVDL